jgi:hypothetical protein
VGLWGAGREEKAVSCGLRGVVVIVIGIRIGVRIRIGGFPTPTLGCG